MTQIDKIKLERLKETYSKNFRITQLYAAYLEHFPEFIKRELVDTLTEDGTVSKTDAISALLSIAFGLDGEVSPEDRILIRDYITPSVRLLDAKKYTENKYNKNIKLGNLKDGSWEFKTESYPAYRGAVSGDMISDPDGREIPPLGFFSERVDFPAVLEDGNEWMTITPVDVDTVEKEIEEAHGRVLTLGLGLGYYTYMVSEKENVESITVVERSQEVINLFKKHILPQFAHGKKVNIVHDDAIHYMNEVMPSEGFDYCFSDIWRDASDGAPLYLEIKKTEKLSPKTRFTYWIEGFIRSRLRAQRYCELLNLIDEASREAPKSYAEFIERLNDF